MATLNASEATPLIFEQSKVGYVDPGEINLPRTNTDGKPVIDPTPEQKFLFDTHGWLLVPGLLSECFGSAIAVELGWVDALEANP